MDTCFLMNAVGEEQEGHCQLFGVLHEGTPCDIGGGSCSNLCLLGGHVEGNELGVYGDTTVTTPPEIISYYRLNHSIWSLSDNKEPSR
jgi:hypothetical protein